MKIALVVLDAQRIYTSRDSELFCPDSASTIDRINALVGRFLENRHPVVLVRHVHKRDGSDLGRLFDFTGEPEEDFNFKEGSEEVEYDARLRRPDGAIEIVKNRYSAFAGTKLASVLKKRGVECVVICGFMTNFCCESTAREALDRDYFVDFVLDATGNPGTESHDETEVREMVGELLAGGFARVVSTEEFLGQS